MYKPNKITTSKYTPLTFLPLNIYYQFSKYNNLFFLVTLILLCIPSISPFTPYTYLIAFSLIIGISMIKDGVEDSHRHQSDKVVNGRLCLKVSNKNVFDFDADHENTDAQSFYRAYVEDISVGDFVCVRDNEEVPADLLLLYTNHFGNERSFCFVQTANLDGESNLKRKVVGDVLGRLELISPLSSVDQNYNNHGSIADKLNAKNGFCIYGKDEINSINNSGYKEIISNNDICINGKDEIKSNNSGYKNIISSTAICINGKDEIKSNNSSHKAIISNNNLCINGKDEINSNNSSHKNNISNNNICINDDSCINKKNRLDSNKNDRYINNNNTEKYNPCNNQDLTSTEQNIIDKISYFDVESLGDLLNDIKCTINTPNTTYTFDHTSILLKGSIIKNTSHILGLVLTVGNNTKQSKNLRVKDLDTSVFERSVNKRLAFVFVGYFLLLAVTGILATLFLTKDGIEYLFLNRNLAVDGLRCVGTNYILFSFLVPISLFVTIEIARVFMALYIKNDAKMFKYIRKNCSDQSKNNTNQEMNSNQYNNHYVNNNSNIYGNNRSNNNSEDRNIHAQDKNFNGKDRNINMNNGENRNYKDGNMNYGENRNIKDGENRNIKDGENRNIHSQDKNFNGKDRNIKDGNMNNGENGNYKDGNMNYDENRNIKDGNMNNGENRNYKDGENRNIHTQDKNFNSKERNIYAQDKNINIENITINNIDNPNDSNNNDDYILIKTQCRNSNVVEDLGMVNHILTDKTGTLTKNEMALKNIHLWNEKEITSIKYLENKLVNGNIIDDEKTYLFVLALLTCNSVDVYNNKIEGQSQDEVCIVEGIGKIGSIVRRSQNGNLIIKMNRKIISEILKKCNDDKDYGEHTNVDECKISNDMDDEDTNKEYSEHTNKNDSKALNDTNKQNISKYYSEHTNKNDSKVLNNTNKQNISKDYSKHTNKNDSKVLNDMDDKDSSKDYSEHINKNDSKVLNDMDDKVVNETGNENNTYQSDETNGKDGILHIRVLMTLEFTSKRQKMGVVVQIGKKIFLFEKGSDQIILNATIGQKENIKRKIDENSMYRSLVFAFKEIKTTKNNNQNETIDIKSLQKQYKNINIEKKDNETDHIFEKMENKMKYLGTTFVDDCVQDGVKECMIDLFKAGISIWMVTGDKKETAMCCGILCGISKNKTRNKSSYDTEHRCLIYNCLDNKKEDLNINNHRCPINNCIDNKQEDTKMNYDTNNIYKDKNKNDDANNKQKDLNMNYDSNNIYKDKNKNDDANNKQEILNMGNDANNKDKKMNGDINNNQQDSNIYKNNKYNDTFNDNQDDSNIYEYYKYKDILNDNQENSKQYENNKYKDILNDNQENSSIYDEDNNKYNDDFLIISATEIIKKLDNEQIDSKKVIIYRASPEQKAKIARKLVNLGKTVLAIGDGNNDVMMLQESNIGVGIQGLEGNQASLCADFSVPSFIVLKRLLLIHGRYNFIRFSKLTINSLYKNGLLILVQFYYNFYNGYSGRPVLNFFFLNYFNVLFTSMIPFYIALFDKDKDETILEKYPELYKEGNRYFSKKLITMNIILAIIKASIIFWASYFILETVDFTKKNGLIGGYSAMNNYFSLIIFLTVLVRQIRLIGFFNWISLVTIIITILLYFGTVFGIQEMNESTKRSAFNVYGMPMFWASFIAVFGITLFLDFIYDITHKKFT